MATIDEYTSKLAELKRVKEPWLIHYQALADIFFTRKSDFTANHTAGEFLNDDVYDNTGQFAAFLFASVFLSMLWPDSSRTFRLRPVPRIKDAEGVEEFFKDATQTLRTAMDRPKAGLDSALMEHFLDCGVFGTSGVGVFEGPKDDESLPLIFKSWDIKGMYISENGQGFVDTVYQVSMLTVRQIVTEYGKENVSPSVLKMFEGGKQEDRVEVLKVIEPKEAEEGKIGVAAMEVLSIHIDTQHKKVMRESGFEEMPIMVSRMFKRTNETYGRSAGMVTLPDASSLNALTDDVLVATEKQLDPPLAVVDNGRLGGGVIDTSAGALNVFNASGNLGNERPIFPLFTVGELQSAEKQQVRLEQKIMQGWFLDRLLDLNNSVQMTAFETSVRNRMRGESLGSIFSRQEKEALTPAIERSFNILWRRGTFGDTGNSAGQELRDKWKEVTGGEDKPIPEAILKAMDLGLDVYEIEYISPAKRFMQAEKLQGIFTVSDALTALEPVIPGITDNIDSDSLAHEVVRYAGAPSEIMRLKKDVEALRAKKEAQQQEVDSLEAARSLSETGRNVAQGQATVNSNGGGNR